MLEASGLAGLGFIGVRVQGLGLWGFGQDLWEDVRVGGYSSAFPVGAIFNLVPFGLAHCSAQTHVATGAEVRGFRVSGFRV